MEPKDPISLAPEISGPRGRAWRVDVANAEEVFGESHAVLDIWIVEAPWAHPIWHSYMITLIHLRPMPDKRLILYVPNASHEMLVYALDDRAPREPLIRGTQPPRVLVPINFGAQFANHTDEAARQRIRDAVQEICAGQLSPDTDHQRAWIDRFGQSMIRREFRETVS